MDQRAFAASRTAWFWRGFLGGILICGALNAASYFVRSDGCGNLLGLAPQHAEALGFPALVWEGDNSYGGYFVDPRAMAVNVLCAVVVGIGSGAVVASIRRRLNELVDQFEQTATGQAGNFRFSLRGLMLLTAIVAVVAAGTRHLLAERPEVLGGIDLLGPWLLVAIALLPRQIAWEQRVLILVPTALLLIGVAVAAGASLSQPVAADKVLLGIFVCWTPQSALAAALIMAWAVFFPQGR